MGKLVLLNLIDGSLEEGFSVGVTIYDEDSRKILNKVHGKLAANSDLENKYLRWQIPYRKLIQNSHSSRMPIEGIDKESEMENDRTNLIREIYDANKQLNRAVNDWLKREGEFSRVCREIDRTLKNEEEEIRLIVDAKNIELQKIPFFLWEDFFTHYHRAEAGLYLPVKNSIENNKKDKVKILAVFGSKEFIGNDTQVRIDNDWNIIKQHLSTKSNGDLIRLQEPTLDNLGDNIELHCPQILFFAGHSFSDKKSIGGQIKLNQNEYITIGDLKYDLKKAAKKGLKLAIFNSCDGMGIARQLEDIGISNIIVMREPVPDEVAHRFLRRFLERFAFGRSINLAVRRGREKLQRLERKYPGVVCLPVLWQNPAEPPLTWEQLGGINTNNNNQNSVIWQNTSIQNFNIHETRLNTDGINNNSANISSINSSTRIQETEIHKNSSNTERENISVSPPSNESNNSRVENSNIENFHGNILRNRYKIIKQLGRGGFGATYLAIDMDFPGEQKCVVKHLTPKNTNSNMLDIAKRLFQTEAMSLSKLGEHNCIPRLYSYFEERGEFYLVQEFIDGQELTLEFQSGNQWSEAKTINFLIELLEVLEYVHKANTIHRDIKPSNIIRRNSDSKLVLVDFGAVKKVLTVNEIGESNTLANRTIAIGTPRYMPIEQAQGKPSKSSDIYAVGMLGIQAITGFTMYDIPYEEDNFKRIIQEHNIEINPKLEQVLSKMVSFDYKNRYCDASEALKAINNIMEVDIETNNIFSTRLNLTKKTITTILSIIILFSTIFYFRNNIVEILPSKIPRLFQKSENN